MFVILSIIINFYLMKNTEDAHVVELKECFFNIFPGVLYHDLGLVYTQCHEFARAATCFELALPLCGQHGKSSHRAVILQNLGAAYNSMHEYHHAVGFHEAAATLHGNIFAIF